MTEQAINKAKEKFAADLRAWSKSQEGQTDGNEYEKTFVKTMQQISEQTLQLSLGEVPQSKNKKKG